MTVLNRIVVVGAGLAGLRAVEGLRNKGYDGEVVIIGAESEHPYDRPPLSKAVLKDGAETPHLRAPTDYESLDVDLRLGTRAESIDTDHGFVRLAGGLELSYDAAIIATGADARTLPQVSSPWLHTIRTAADSANLRRQMLEYGEIVIIGAGFLGAEVAATARSLGVAVTMVETQPTPLARVIGPELGIEIAELHVANGVDVRLGEAPVAFASDDDGAHFTFASGAVVSGKVVLVAIGANPCTDWLSGSGIKVDDGILCDEFGRTTADGVWAIGDSSSWYDLPSNGHRRFEHWTNAVDQADVVAHNLLHDDDLLQFDRVRYFWSDQYHLKIQALGDPDPADLVEVLKVGPDQRTIAVYARNGAVSAVVGIGAPRFVMRTRNLIAGRVPVEDVLATLR